MLNLNLIIINVYLQSVPARLNRLKRLRLRAMYTLKYNNNNNNNNLGGMHYNVTGCMGCMLFDCTFHDPALAALSIASDIVGSKPDKPCSSGKKRLSSN